MCTIRIPGFCGAIWGTRFTMLPLARGILLLTATMAVAAPRGSAAQDRTVRGVVVDSAGKPMPNVYVELNDRVQSALLLTDRQGRFQLPLSAQTGCAIRISRSRYRTVNVDLPSCADTTIRVMMIRSPDESGGSGPRCGTRSTDFCRSPNGLEFQTISAGQAHTCGTTRDRVAWCWGDGRKGALGSDSTVQRWPVRVATNLRFVDIAAGGNFSCGVATDGNVYCWGTSEVVPGWPKRVSQPAPIGQFGTGARLTAGRRHACVLDEQARAWCWGWNVDGETGTGSSGIASSLLPTPTPIAGEYRFRSLSAGMGFTCGVTTQNELVCWGSNVDRILGGAAAQRCGDVDPIPCSPQPVVVQTPDLLRLVSVGTTHACALNNNGTVLCWGTNGHGQLGDITPTVAAPQRVVFPGAETFEAISSGGIETCGVTASGNLYCWGADPRRQNAHELSTDDVRPRLVARDVRGVSLGQTHACAVNRTGRVLCWGDTMLGGFGPR